MTEIPWFCPCLLLAAIPVLSRRFHDSQCTTTLHASGLDDMIFPSGVITLVVEGLTFFLTPRTTRLPTHGFGDSAHDELSPVRWMQARWKHKGCSATKTTTKHTHWFVWQQPCMMELGPVSTLQTLDVHFWPPLFPSQHSDVHGTSWGKEEGHDNGSVHRCHHDHRSHQRATSFPPWKKRCISTRVQIDWDLELGESLNDLLDKFQYGKKTHSTFPYAWREPTDKMRRFSLLQGEAGTGG